MHKKGHLLAKEGNYAKQQVDAFIDNIAKENFELLGGFDWGKEWLDDFYRQWLNEKDK